MPFPNNNSDNEQDSATRKGIIILSIILVALIGFFIWYNYKFSRPLSTASNKEGFLSNLFSGGDQTGDTVSDDSDNDGLSTDEEKKINSDSEKIDSDGDGLTDGEEVKVYSTNPLQADSDNDKVNDGDEIKNRHNPLDPSPDAVWPPVPTNIIS
jgi:hypothetical protein